MNEEMRSVSVLGCGWFGLELASELVKDGWNVKGSCTRTEKFELLQQRGISPFQVVLHKDEAVVGADFLSSDILVICIPPNRKAGEAPEYPLKLQKIVDHVLKMQVQKVLFISSTGVYPDNNQEVDEFAEVQPDSESGKALHEAEELLRRQQGSYKATIVRFGGLVGPGRDPGRFFAGKKNIPNGKAPVNLIHLRDCVGIAKAILEQQAFGYVFNACSEEHPQKMDFYVQAAERAGLERPEFIEELKTWKLVKSRNLHEMLGYKTGPLF